MGAITSFMTGPGLGSTGAAKKWNDSVTNWGDTQAYFEKGAQGIKDYNATSNDQQLASRDQALAEQLSGQNQALGYSQPYYDAGTVALKDLAGLNGPGGTYDRSKAIIDAPTQQSPEFAYLNDLAQRNLNQQLAGRGKYFSGRAVAEGTNDLNNKMAANLWDRSLAEKQMRIGTENQNYSNIRDLAGMGAQFAAGNASLINSGANTRAGLYTNAANQVSNSNNQAGESLSNLYTKLGNLRYENSAGKHMLSMLGGQ